MSDSFLTPYEINEIKSFTGHVYYDGKLCKKKYAQNDLYSTKDKENRYVVARNDHIYYRYEVIKHLGKGVFGDVFLVFDHKNQKSKALKILRSEPRFYNCAKYEAYILRTLNKNNCKFVINMEEKFLFRKHFCFIFEYCKISNLYKLLSQNNFKGLEIKYVQKYAQQILEALKDIHAQNIMHCDLKPENIALIDDIDSDIRILDFGSSCFLGGEKKYRSYIQSRYYRAPEVILGLDYNTKIDIWSFGTIIFELLLGSPLFPADNTEDLLFHMLKTLNYPDKVYLSKSPFLYKFFDNDFVYLYPDERNEDNMKPLKRRLKDYPPQLLSFVSKCLIWDISERPTAEELLKHQFLSLKF